MSAPEHCEYVIAGWRRKSVRPRGQRSVLSVVPRSRSLSNTTSDGHPAIFAAGLSGDPGLGLRVAVARCGRSAAGSEFHDQHRPSRRDRILLLTGLDQQGNDMDHDGVRVGGALQLSRAGAYGWMHDPLEVSAGRRVSRRRSRRGASAVQLPVAAAPGGRTARRSRPSAGVPGSTTSRASTSASMTIAPRAASSAATKLFPEAIPPVKPTRTRFLLRARARSGSTDRRSASRRRHDLLAGRARASRQTALPPERWEGLGLTSC